MSIVQSVTIVPKMWRSEPLCGGVQLAKKTCEAVGMRLCIDPQPLNKALKRSHYPLHVLDDILPNLSNAKVFSVCDVQNGFWHFKLDEDSSRLTTFNTPFGRYRWTRLPFGVAPALELFQRHLDQALEGLGGVHTIAGDILVCGYGRSQEEADNDHDENLQTWPDFCSDVEKRESN